MEYKHRYLLNTHRFYLERHLDMQKIRYSLEKSKIFTKLMLDDIYDDKNFNCLLIPELTTRGPQAFDKFLNILHECGYDELCLILENDFKITDLNSVD